MSDLNRMMREAAAKPTEHPDVDQAWRRARLQRAGFVALSLVAVIAVTGGAVIATTNISESDTRPALPGEIEVGGGGGIVFSRFSQDGGIFVMNGDGSEPRRVADGDHYALDFPAWSPDGSKIAFHGFFGEAANEDGGLFVMNADGSGLKLLELAGTTPTWSPDGREIAFNTGGSLRVIGADGENSRTLVEHKQGSPNAEFPDWSPDGSKIVFTSNGIWIVDSDGSNLHRFQEHVIDDRPVHPTWSPNGTQIAFTAYIGDGPTGNIDVVNVDGTGRRTVTQGHVPTWSSDGQRIAFERIDGDVSHIYSINVDGTDLRQLTFGPDSDHSPDWVGIESENEDPSPPDVEPQVSATVAVGQFPRAIDVGEGYIWVTVEDPDLAPGFALTCIDPSTNEIVDSLPLEHAGDVAVAGGAVWVISNDDSAGPRLLQIDPRTNSIMETISLSCRSNDDTPDCYPVNVAARHGALWVTLESDRSLSGEVIRIDPRRAKIVARIPIDEGGPRDIVAGAGWVWVDVLSKVEDSVVEGASLVRIDPDTNDLPASCFATKSWWEVTSFPP